MKTILIISISALFTFTTTGETVSGNLPHPTGGPAIEIVSAIPRDIAFVVVVRENSVFLKNLIENGIIAEEDVSGVFGDISGVEESSDLSPFDIFTGEVAVAMYDRRDYGEKGESFVPGLLAIAEMPSDISLYEDFEDDLVERIEGEEEAIETDSWSSKIRIKIKNRKYHGTKYKYIKKTTETESRYTDTDGNEHKYGDESENEFYLGYNESYFVLTTDERMYKKAVDTGRSGGGLSGDIDYLSCLSRVNPDSELITYAPADGFDILKDILERESRDRENVPFAELLDNVAGMMTSASLGDEGPTDEAVILFPRTDNNPFIRALGERKPLTAPAAVPAGYTAYFFYACDSINQTIVEVIPGLVSALEESDASDRRIDEITGTIAYFQELSPGLLSSAGDEIAVVYRQKETDVSYADDIPQDRELPERLKATVDEYIVVFNIADRNGFEQGMSYLDENTPDSDIKTAGSEGATFYTFITEGETEAVIVLRDGWGYGALRQETLDYYLDRLDDGTLSDDDRFIDGMGHLQPEHNALVYLDYSAAFEDRIDNDRLSGLIRPTMISIVYDGEAVEIEGYPYNFWTYFFSSSYALGSMDMMSGAGGKQ
ncbi:MAG: hypothetical protein GY771_15325 [bacterium]|nr:hypothetical protein [bacterium]